jgi:hypothetical protein
MQPCGLLGFAIKVVNTDSTCNTQYLLDQQVTTKHFMERQGHGLPSLPWMRQQERRHDTHGSSDKK